jgi:RNA polymerase sigma-70 factor (ECF subfamily)
MTSTELDDFPTLTQRYQRELLAHCYRMSGSVHEAEDLVQETFLRAFKAFDGFQPGTNIRAWLYTILHRARTDAFRKAGRSPRTVELEGEGPPVPPPQDALASGREDLERALAALPEVFRQAVVLRDVEDFSYDEIARILEVPIGTVMSRIHRGRAQLRTMLGGKP